MITEEEKLEHLIIEIKSTRNTKEFESKTAIIEGRHHIGKTIIEHDLYKEWKKGTGDLIKQISKQTQITTPDLYLYMQAAKEYEEVSMIIERLPPGKPTWTAVRRLLEGKKEIRCKHHWEKIEAWGCTKCNSIRRTKP